jgi:parallel beta-helix repeat protein
VAAAVAATFSLVVPVPIASAAPAAIAEDAFSRIASNTWGSADTGGAYSLTRATSTEVGTTGSVGYEKLTTSAEFTAQLKATSAADVTISDTISISAIADTAYDVQHRWNVRQQSDRSAYTGRIRITSDGAANLGVSRLNGSGSTWLQGLNLPFDINQGQSVRGEVQVSGNSPVTVSMRAWLVGTPTPDWQITYSDSSASRVTAAGSVGITDYAYLTTNPVTLTHDDLYAGAPGTAPEPPAPTTPAPSTPAPSTTAPSTPSESAPPTPGPATNRGSAAVGSASYPVPAGAIFVAPNGNNSNAGTEAAPLRTVMAAVPKIPSNGARTIVLRGGTYHESVKLESNRTATIQNYPGEEVWFDGSVPVTNWSKSGSTWVASGWKAEFGNTMGSTAAFKNQFIGSNKMAADPDLLFLDGLALKQVGTAAEVVAGTFLVNDAADTLTIGSDPTGKQVRASDLAQAIFLSGKDSVIQGIGVRRFANPYEVKGAVRLVNFGGTVRDVVIEDVATFGLTISSPDKSVDHVTVQRAGIMGIGGNQMDNSTITNSIFNNNNTEGFNAEPEAGGMKITASRTVTVKNVDASNNVGATGIWFDVSSHNVNVLNSTANGNTKYGIEMEISGHGIIANNQAIGGEAGITIFDSHDFKVFNNDVGNNTLYGIKLAQDERRQANLGTFPHGRDTRRANVVDPTVTWITKNVQLSNNAFGKGIRNHSHVHALDARTNRPVDSWNLTVNGNLFNKARFLSSEPTMVSWGKGDNVTLERYETSGDLAAAKNSSWENAQLSTTKAIADMSADKATHASIAVPIPSDVAAASGLPAGAQLLGAQ